MIRAKAIADTVLRRNQVPAQTDERIYTASQWLLIWHKFRRHKLALIGGIILAIMYTLAIFAPFFTPYGPNQKFNENLYTPPTPIHFFDAEGNFSLRPFVYGLTKELDMNTLETKYHPDTSQKYYLRFF